MSESKHEKSRQKVCLCSKKSIRALSSLEKQKINNNREEEVDFEKDCFPVGVCKTCEFNIRVNQPVKIAYWDDHAKGGLHFISTYE